MNYQHTFRVKSGSRVRLEDFDPRFATKHPGRKTAALATIGSKHGRKSDWHKGRAGRGADGVNAGGNLGLGNTLELGCQWDRVTAIGRQTGNE